MTRKEFYQNLYSKGVKDPATAKQYEQKWLESGRAFDDQTPVDTIKQQPAIQPNIAPAPADTTRVAPEQQQPKAQQVKSNIVSDAVNGLTDRIVQRAENVNKPTVLGDLLNLKQGTIGESIAGTPERALRTGLGAFGSAADVVMTPVNVALSGVNKLSGGRLGDLAVKAINATGIPQIASNVADKVNQIPESERANYGAALSGVEGLSQFAGIKATPKVINSTGKVVKPYAEAFKRGAEQHAERAGKVLTSESGALKLTAGAGDIPRIEDLTVKDIKAGKIKQVVQPTGEIVDVSKIKQPGLPFLKDLTIPETKTLNEKKAPATIPFTTYAKQSEAVGNSAIGKAINPQQLAATNFTKGFKKIEDMANKAGEDINKIVNENKDKAIDIAPAKQRFIEAVDDRIGGLTEGQVTADPSALKAAQEITNMLLNLPDKLDPKSAWFLKRNLRQSIKYDAAGQLRPKNTVLESIQKDVSNMIDEAMDKELKGFKEANEKYSKYIKVEDAFSRALGPEFGATDGLTKHGASIVKRAIQSNADSNINDILRLVKEATDGEYDLFQDAAYANIAMRLSGDPDQFYKASRFGGVAPNMPSQGGSGLTMEVINKGTQAAGKLREWKTGGKLSRVVDWYEKAQGTKPVTQQPKQQTLGSLANQKGSTSSSVLARTTLGSLAGGTIGATQGDTPEERKRNAILGALTGAGAGSLASKKAIGSIMKNKRGSIDLSKDPDEYIVYHGSKYGLPKDINDDKAYIGSMFFTTDKDVASNFSKGKTPTGNNGEWEHNGDDFKNEVIKAKVKIKKPITDETTLEDMMPENEADEFREEMKYYNPQPFTASIDEDSDLALLAHSYAQYPKFREYLKNKGYDGWVFDDLESGGTTVVPFSKTQIKIIK